MSCLQSLTHFFLFNFAWDLVRCCTAGLSGLCCWVLWPLKPKQQAVKFQTDPQGWELLRQIVNFCGFVLNDIVTVHSHLRHLNVLCIVIIWVRFFLLLLCFLPETLLLDDSLLFDHIKLLSSCYLRSASETFLRNSENSIVKKNKTKKTNLWTCGVFSSQLNIETQGDMFSICTVAAVSWCSNSTSIELDHSAAIIQGTDALFEALSEELVLISPFNTQ